MDREEMTLLDAAKTYKYFRRSDWHNNGTVLTGEAFTGGSLISYHLPAHQRGNPYAIKIDDLEADTWVGMPILENLYQKQIDVAQEIEGYIDAVKKA